MKKLIPLYTIIGLLIATAACDLIDNNQDESRQFVTSEAFRSELKTALSTYLHLSEALAKENEEDARAYAGQLAEAISAIDATGLDGEAADYWDEHAGNMHHHGKAIHGQNGLRGQREAFAQLSDAMIDVVHAMGPMDETLYHRSCHMFNDDETGWLSHHEEINHNPYQGEHMNGHHDGRHHNGHNSGHYGDHMSECVRTVKVIE